LDGQTGLTVEADDVSGLASAVAKLLDDPGLAAMLAHAGREHATGSFAVERLVDDLDRLYRQLLTGVGPIRPQEMGATPHASP
jgi:glycosyltransferase involved in cell wall biosynthesis